MSLSKEERERIDEMEEVRLNRQLKTGFKFLFIGLAFVAGVLLCIFFFSIGAFSLIFADFGG